jgi:autotransporter-associated beta strand protein
LNGFNVALNGLTGAGNVVNDATSTARTLTVGYNNATSIFAGAIKDNTGTGGTVALTKTGGGILTLSGTNNTYTGGTIISAGTLKAGADNTLPYGAGTGDVTVTGTLDLNGFDLAINGLSGTSTAGKVVNDATGTAKTLTVGYNNATSIFAGAIKDNTGTGGTVALTKVGDGAMTLSGTNTYTGATNVNVGTLQATKAASLPGQTTLGKITVAGDATLAINAGGASEFTETDITNILTNAAFSSVASILAIDTTNASGGTFAYTGDITAALSLTKLGAGALTLSGANTYGGDTTISAGTLKAGADDTLPHGTGKGNVSLAGTLDLNGFNVALNGLTGAGNVVNDADGTDTTLTVGNNDATSVFAGVIADNTGTGGTVALTKVGGGTLTLAGTTANTYTGMTTVSAGEVDLNKAAGVDAIGGNVTVNGTSTLKFLVSEQIVNNAIITQTSGTFDLNGMTETITNYYKSSGIFRTGVGGHLIGTGGSITWSGGTNTINDGGSVEDVHIVISSGTNIVEGGASGGVLQLDGGGYGLEITGATLTLNSDNAVAGRLLLKGDLTSHASTKASNISNGGTLANPGNIDLNGGTRTFTVEKGKVPSGAADLSISAAITGGGLTKTGGGTLRLDGTVANTYTGMTTVSAGELDLNKTAGVNAIGGNVTIGGTGTLKFLVSEQIINSSIISQTAGTFNLNGMTETIAAFTNSGGIFSTGAGGRLIGGGATITWSGGTNTVNDGGAVEDAHVVITGGTNHVRGGATGGVLQVNAGGTGLEITGADLLLDSDNAVAGRLLLKGDLAAYASAMTSNISNSGALSNPGNIDLDDGIRTFTVEHGADLSISAVITNGGLIKAGDGRMLLTGINPYAKNTTIMQGVLEIAASGSIAKSPVIELKSGATLDVRKITPPPWTLASGQMLRGGGTVMGDMAVGNLATISPGDTGGAPDAEPGNPGTLTQSPGSETWAGGGTYLWEVNTVDTSVIRQPSGPSGLQGRNPGFDFLAIAGDLNIDATSGSMFTIDIVSLDPSTGTEGAVANWDKTKPYEWVIATAGGSITNFDPEAFDLNTTRFHNEMAPGASFVVRKDGDHDIVLVYVPEPATLALLGMGSFVLLLGRKRK